MTAADKLRELLATRPATPNAEELVRWWRTCGELLPAVLDRLFAAHEFERQFLAGEFVSQRAAQDSLRAAKAEIDKLRNCAICPNCGRCSVDEDGCCATCGRDCILIEDDRVIRPLEDGIDPLEHSKLREQVRQLTADLDDARAKLRREQDARAELRVELDRHAADLAKLCIASPVMITVMALLADEASIADLCEIGLWYENFEPDHLKIWLDAHNAFGAARELVNGAV